MDSQNNTPPVSQTVAKTPRNNFLILVIVILLLIIVGGASYFFGIRSSQPNSQTINPIITNTPLPSSAISPTNSSLPTITLDQTKKTGTIKGELGYPAEMIPPLDVYAISSVDSTKFFALKTNANQQSFTITDVEPGTYVLVAYSGATYAGGYTKSVPCGLSVDCNDHTLIPVTVKAGETNGEAQIKDWYAPEGTFPTKPK